MVVGLAPSWIKVLGSFLCLALSLLFGFVSRYKHLKTTPKALSYVNIVGGGVLISVVFSHLLPEVEEGFEYLHYPVGSLIVLLSYIVLIILEKVLFEHKHVVEDEYLMNSDKKQEQEQQHQHKHNDMVTPLMLLLGLCIHSLFEGLAFGLQSTSFKTLSLMFAIICHKPVESLLLGIVMVKGNIPLWVHIIAISFLSVVTPAGVCVGLMLGSLEVSVVTIATFSAIAAGTFLYISTTEIISEEFHSSAPMPERWKRLFCLVCGVAFIFILRIWLGEHHQHETDTTTNTNADVVQDNDHAHF